MKSCGIYSIVHLPSGLEYIGHSSQIESRWAAHLKLLRRGGHHSPYFQNIWNKHGEEEFDFRILELCDRSILVEREQFYFDTRTPALNCAPVAGSRLGVPQSPEVRQRISAAMTGRDRSPETCRKLSEALIGRKLSAEHCANIRTSKANVSEATRAKLRALAAGRTISAETRVKMSAALKGRKLTPEHIEKVRRAMVGRTFSPETRAKMSAANKSKGSRRTEETKLKMSLAQLARRERERQSGQ